MADYSDITVLTPVNVVEMTGSARATSPALVVSALEAGGGGGAPVVTYYLQRIWDLTLGQWVLYELTTVTAAPLASATTPNHSGNLKSSSHVVVQTRKA